MRTTTLYTLIAIVAALPALGQGVVVDGNVETAGQLISRAPSGVEPMVVSSTTRVRGLNADRVDGLEAADFALEADLQAAELLLVTLEAQVGTLGTAPVRRSGQSTCYSESGDVIACGSGAGVGQDGHTQLGVDWPVPRFTKNGDGTVTDNLTGLIWLEDVSCANQRLDQLEALAFANTLFDGSIDHAGGDCGLSDGSLPGQWRLPNVMEHQSLAHYGFASPAIPSSIGTGQWSEGDPFAGVRSDFYWTSTSMASYPSAGWLFETISGSVRYASKLGSWRVWPVRSDG